MSVIHGVTNPISWFIIINEPIETVASYLEKYAFLNLEINDDEYINSHDSFNSFVTLQHETIHFWQGIKRPFRNTHKVFLTPKFLLCHLLSKNPQTEFL